MRKQNRLIKVLSINMKFIIKILFMFIIFMEILVAQNNDLSLTEQLAYSTVRLEVDLENGKAVGTSFFFLFEFNDSVKVLVLVTNKHVINGGKVGTFLLTEANPDASPNNKSHLPVKLNEFEKRWILHPEKDVELAIMPVAPLFEEIAKKGKHIFYRHLDNKIIPSQAQLSELTAVEDILMVGYPIGLWDPINNYPIFRRGITATHPNNDYNGKSEFMIDAACFPGSSGSPIFLFNVGNYVNKQGGTVIGSRFYFLGILYAGPQYTTTGELKIINVPTKQDTITVTQIPMNLGLAIKSKKLNDFKPIIETLLKKSGEL